MTDREKCIVTVYGHLPKGWSFLSEARTAPYGYKWISNGKSRFSSAYEHALLRVDMRKEG